MPRVVDHEQRRRAIVEAVYRVIEDRGMQAVSLRDVAAEASVSMGAVQHYFRTKDAMILFAMQNMRERVLARLQLRLGRLRNPTHRQYIREAARVMLPLDSQSRQEALVNMAFFSRALADDELRTLVRQGYQRLAESSVSMLQQAQESGEIDAEIDVEVEGRALFFQIEGLVGSILVGATSGRAAMALIDARLDAIFGV